MSALLKRIFDIALACAMIVLLSPLMVYFWLKIRKDMGSPAIFRQERPGLDGAPFNMYKFRTMKVAFGNDGTLVPDNERLTPLGRKLRSTSIDELPELWNVIKGEMSFVGPRPLLMEYLPLYSKDQARRHNVRPGITGWAQVNGRNTISWEEKFRLDIWYIENQSLWLDIKIIFMTAKRVFMRDGIAAEGEATMPKFKGSGTTG